MAEVRFDISKLDDWARGFDGLESHMAEEGLRAWQGVTDLMFGRTQQYVHVITAYLKASGSVDTEAHRDEIVGTITYDAEYAEYERRRGGEHDFMTRAYVATQDQFEGTLAGLWEQVAARF